MAQQTSSLLIWYAADVSGGMYKRSEDGDVILSFTVFRGLGFVLVETMLQNNV